MTFHLSAERCRNMSNGEPPITSVTCKLSPTPIVDNADRTPWFSSTADVVADVSVSVNRIDHGVLSHLSVLISRQHQKFIPFAFNKSLPLFFFYWPSVRDDRVARSKVFEARSASGGAAGRQTERSHGKLRSSGGPTSDGVVLVELSHAAKTPVPTGATLAT